MTEQYHCVVCDSRYSIDNMAVVCVACYHKLKEKIKNHSCYGFCGVCKENESRAEKAEICVKELEAKLTSVKEANQIELNQALALAKPGRILPLDENMGTNSEGVALLVEAIKTLAKFLAAALEALKAVDKEVHPKALGMWPGLGDCFVKVRKVLASLPPSALFFKL